MKRDRASRSRRQTRRPRPRPAARRQAVGRRALHKEATKQRILAAALELFQTRGFDGTTTRSIARRARIAEGTVFNYFRTKDDIALYFFEQEIDHAIARVRDSARLKHAPIEERLFVLIQSQLDYLAPHERFLGAALVHALTPASKLGPFGLRSQELQARYLAFVQELLEDAIARREISPLAWWMPLAFWVFYLGTVMYWLHDTSPGKEQTLAFLDRSLRVAVGLLRKDARGRRR